MVMSNSRSESYLMDSRVRSKIAIDAVKALDGRESITLEEYYLIGRRYVKCLPDAIRALEHRDLRYLLWMINAVMDDRIRFRGTITDIEEFISDEGVPEDVREPFRRKYEEAFFLYVLYEYCSDRPKVLSIPT